MTEKERKMKLEELKNLKLLLRFHNENRVIEKDRKFNNYVDEILDEMNRIEEELKNQ